MSVFRNLDCLSLVVCSNTTLLKRQTVLFLLFFQILRFEIGGAAYLWMRLIHGRLRYASMKPSINYSKDKLNDVKNTEEPIKQLKQDLTSGGRLETLELVCTEGNFRDLQGLLQKYIKALVKDIDRRFRSSLPVLSAFFQHLIPC